MKNIFKFFGIVAIMLFSFYYTEKIALYAQRQSPIMRSINEVKNNLMVSSIDAKIENEYITPGLNGLEVNVEESFSKMKSFNTFNSYYIIFDQIQPEISLENNRHKIINKGNKLKRSVSLIIENNSEIYDFLLNNNIKADILMNLETYDNTTKFEIINNETTKFSKLETLLNKSELNKNLCFVNNLNKQYCVDKKYYLIESTKELNSSNIATIKGNIESGDIILIKNSVRLEDLKLLINQIKYQDLNIVYLSELITEENN